MSRDDPQPWVNLPKQLRGLKRFLLWKASPGENGKTRKTPYYADGGIRKGRLDTEQDLARLVTFEEAHDEYICGGYSGIGFALAGEGIGAFDLDKCLDAKGHLKKDHAGHDLVLAAKAKGAYIEVSPSGRGLRIVGLCPNPEAYSKDGLEYWGAKRFVTLTGNVWANPRGWADLEDLRASLGARQKPVADDDDDEGPIITPKIITELKSALEAITEADEYELWIRLGLALKTIGDKGKALWLEWSAKSKKFNEADALARWEGFDPQETHYRSVFVEAQKNWGWKNPRAKARQDDEDETQAGGGRKHFPFEWAGEIEPKFDALWLIKKTLPENGLALIFGHPSCGKTFLALDMAAHVALGWDWQGHKVRKGTVVYVGAEGYSGLKNRVVAFRERYGEKIEGSFPLALVGTSMNLYDSKSDLRGLADTIQEAADQMGEEPVLIVVDTISKTFGGGKENTDDLANYVANCGWLASKFGCCILLVHHRPKSQESSDPRGHSSLKGGLDTVILVEGGPVKRAKVTKQRDGEERDLLAFRLQTHALGRDSDGDLVTSCTVEEVDASLIPQTPVERAVSKLGQNDRLAWLKFAELFDEEPMPVPHQIPEEEFGTGAPSQVISLERWRDKVMLAFGTEMGRSDGTARKAYNRAKIELQNRNFIRVYGEWAWLTSEVSGTELGR